MSEIDFETGEPIWSVEVYHQQPNQSASVYPMALNAATEDEAIQKAIEKFDAEGLQLAYVTQVIVTEMKTLEGGEDG